MWSPATKRATASTTGYQMASTAPKPRSSRAAASGRRDRRQRGASLTSPRVQFESNSPVSARGREGPEPAAESAGKCPHGDDGWGGRRSCR